jgi:hypothetical protein
MAAEYDWVPNTNRGTVKLWLDATATTPEGKQLYGNEILTSPLGPFEFNLNWSKGDPIGRPIVRLVGLTLRDDVQAGTQLRLRLRNPGDSGEWPGPTSGIGPVAILDVVKQAKSEAPGETAPVGSVPEAAALAQASTAPITDNAAVPEKNRSGLGGQSVPDEFDGPSDREVLQGDVLVFPYRVINLDTTNAPVELVSFSIVLPGGKPPFSSGITQTRKNAKVGPHAFAATVAADAVPGDYTMWAILAPYKDLGGAGKAQTFKLKVKQRPVNP